MKSNRRSFLFTGKTIINSWIFSYVLIVSIPILLSSYLLFHSLQYMQAENEKLCRSEMNNLCDTMDSYLNEIKHIALEFSMDSNARFLSSTGSDTPQRHYTIYEVQKKIKHYIASNSNIQNMGILFAAQDAILTDSSYGPIRQFKDKLLDPQLIEFLSQGEFQNHYYYLPSSETFTFILSLPYDVNVASNCYFFITLNSKIWQNICDNQAENTFQVIIDNNHDQSVSVPLAEEPAEDDLVLYQESQVSTVSYSLIFRGGETVQHIHTIQLAIVLSSVVCIFVSIFLVYYFTKKHYMPLLHLVKKAAPDFIQRQGNEFHILEKHIDSIQQENFVMEQELLKTHTVVEEVYLAKLMQANYSQEEYLQIAKLPIWQHPEEGEKLNLAVLIFSVDYTSEKFDYNDTEEVNLVRFIIKNILGDLIDPELHWQSTYLEENLLVLIHGSHSALNQICSSITSQMPPLLSSFAIRIQIGFSIGCQTLPQVHLLYKEAQKALVYCHLYGTTHALYQDNIDRQNAAAQDVQIAIRVQHKFQNAILAQNYDSALQMLPELFANNFSNEHDSSLLRLNMYSLINLYRSCLLKLIEKNSYLSSIIDNQITSLLNCLSLDNLQKQFVTCLQELNDRKSSQCLSKQEILIDEVKEYIEIHYSENTLSAGQIADHFQMPLSTFSKWFKKYTQMGVLDYIHHVRINQAKVLLQTSKYTVNEVASMTGYLSASTFIRIFKKYEGISPGTLIES